MNSSSKLTIIILLAALIAVGSGVSFLRGLGDNTGYAPEQPLPFSHALHAGEMKIECAYCHVGIEKSKHATIPAMNVCMNCHKVVKPNSPHIQKLKENYNSDTALEWIKVHDLPDHVRFSHARHINAGVNCTSCHGDVANMEKITQVKSLSMGFCVDCHKEHNAPIDCQGCHH